MKGLKYISLVLVLLSFLKINGQEQQLSQYFNAKMLYNPAQTGAIDSDYRVSLNHRSQWKTVSNPFLFSAFSLEAKWKTRSGGAFGAGFNFSKNQAGKSALVNQLYAGNFAYHLKGNRKNNFTLGLQLGLRQRTVNFDGLAWDSQYNGVAYDPALPTGENFGPNKQKSLDASFGFLWRHNAINGRKQYDLGYTVYHYYQKQNFLSNTDDKLLPKQAVDFAYYFSKKQYDIEILSRFTMHGGSFELITGGLAKYRYGRDSRYTNNMTSSLLVFGALYRYRDAFIPTVGYNYKRKFSAYLSYDVNISKLRSLSKFRGAWEINIQYTGMFSDKRIKMKGLGN